MMLTRIDGARIHVNFVRDHSATSQFSNVRPALSRYGSFTTSYGKQLSNIPFHAVTDQKVEGKA